jgi:hypothetical protein
MKQHAIQNIERHIFVNHLKPTGHVMHQKV